MRPYVPASSDLRQVILSSLLGNIAKPWTRGVWLLAMIFILLRGSVIYLLQGSPHISLPSIWDSEIAHKAGSEVTMLFDSNFQGSRTFFCPKSKQKAKKLNIFIELNSCNILFWKHQNHKVSRKALSILQGSEIAMLLVGFFFCSPSLNGSEEIDLSDQFSDLSPRACHAGYLKVKGFQGSRVLGQLSSWTF